MNIKIPVTQCEIEVTHIPEEHEKPSDQLDKSAAAWVQRQLRRGNTWAWSTITVTVTFQKFTAETSLGCCSYRNRQDFISSAGLCIDKASGTVSLGGYYDDMVQECITEIESQIEQAAKESGITAESDSKFIYTLLGYNED